jgi:hypothetical protein
MFYQIGLHGTILGVVLDQAAHGRMLAIWIASSAAPLLRIPSLGFMLMLERALKANVLVGR